MRNTAAVLILSFVSFANSAASFAQPSQKQQTTDTASQAALGQTNGLLNDPAQMKAAAKKDPKATAALNQVDKVTKDPAQQKQLYRISSKIFDRVIKANGGNGDAALEQIDKDPYSFYNSLSPEEKKEISDLASQIQEGPLGGAQH